MVNSKLLKAVLFLAGALAEEINDHCTLPMLTGRFSKAFYSQPLVTSDCLSPLYTPLQDALQMPSLA